VSEFAKRRKIPSGLAPWCLACFRVFNKEWHGKPETKLRIRDRVLRKKYGISLQEFDDLLIAQGGVCAICKKVCERKTRGANNSGWHVDHKHGSVPVKVRGILCGNCNIMLGNAQDSQEILLSAAEYIRNSVETDLRSAIPNGTTLS
jgi:hypothetical protein